MPSKTRASFMKHYYMSLPTYHENLLTFYVFTNKLTYIILVMGKPPPIQMQMLFLKGSFQELFPVSTVSENNQLEKNTKAKRVYFRIDYFRFLSWYLHCGILRFNTCVRLENFYFNLCF